MNFLLLDKETHDAFDDGFIGIISIRDSNDLVIRVFRTPIGNIERATYINSLNGRRLTWPNTVAKPYRRILGWFARLAKGSTVVNADVGAELDYTLDGSEDSSGNEALKGAIQSALRLNHVIRSWTTV